MNQLLFDVRIQRILRESDAIAGALRGVDHLVSADDLDRPRENISARFRPMERAGKISETGERRNGSLVWRV